ncbi:unnamed protein product, partial [Rotaria sp. Silwood2]
MSEFLSCCLSYSFADGLAAVLAGSIGMKYSNQCIELERKLQLVFEHLEFYSALTVQSINYAKTEALWSARAIGNSKFEILFDGNKIPWVNKFKYLGYWITPKLG